MAKYSKIIRGNGKGIGKGKHWVKVGVEYIVSREGGKLSFFILQMTNASNC